MDTGQNSTALHGLAQILVSEGLLEEKAALAASKKADDTKTHFINYIVQNNILPANMVAEAAARDLGMPLFDLEAMVGDLIPIDLVSEKLILSHHALPLYKRGDTLFVALSDPTQQTTVNEFKFHTGLNTRSILVEGDKLTKLIEDALSAKDSESLDGFLDDEGLEDLEISSGEEEKNDDVSGTDDAPIVRFVHKILLDAIHQGASDIHFEPYEDGARVRFRSDGILSEQAHPPPHLANRITARLKVMAQLDISERRVPQDGRFKMNVSRNNAIDFRVSTCPVTAGEKVVLRILDPSAAEVGIEALGFFKKQEEDFLKAIHRPQGMVLVTGPTGSGKTVSLYTALKILNTNERNISTVEDPVEIKVSGINQVNINLKTGLTFSSALRSFLRQDPDIIMVGEMRDLETAEIGVKAAQTGHLVLSTLHTNSAPETLSRLLIMGIPAYNIASSVNLVIAQRLARRLCANCKTPVDIPKDALIEQGFSEEDDLDNVVIYKPVGCELCAQGYKGRVGLFEVLPFSKAIGEMVMSGGTSLDIEKQAKLEGMITIRESGLINIKDGLTSLEELSRVTTE